MVTQTIDATKTAGSQTPSRPLAPRCARSFRFKGFGQKGFMQAVGHLCLLLCLTPWLTAAAHKRPSTLDPGAAGAALSDYIQRVQAASAAQTRSPGSLWSEDGRLTRLSSDRIATHPHDLISIVVSESLTASTDGTVKNTRASSANAQIASLFGSLSASNSLQNLINQNAASALSAQGQSVTDSSLSTIVGGEVMAVLPNGALIVQADRQVSFNQQTQTIRLRGVVRPADINAQNQVLSTSITDLELEVVGKGIINDFTYRQNAIVRLLEKILVF